MATSSLCRLADYAQLAASAAKGRFSFSQAARSRAQQHIAERLGRMRGLPQKMGQLLSLCEMEEDVAASYADLHDNAEPLAWSELVPLLEEQWGVRVSSIVESIDPNGHAASLGQVHRLTLHNGRQVAVKVQYPGVREALDSDLAMLGWLTKPIGGLQRGFDLDRYQATLRESLLHELDYRREAADQRRFAKDWQGDSEFAIPEVVDELSTARVLVTRWETGLRLSEVVAQWPASEKRKVATLLVRFFLRSLFVHGIIHADWHPGNFRFRSTARGPQLVVYDFGCVWRPTAEERTALRQFLTHSHTPEVAWNSLLTLGFDRSALAPLAGRLPALGQLLSKPFASTEPFDPTTWNLGARSAEILGDDRWNFRIAAPPSLLFLMRTLHGLLKFLTDLNAPIAWLPLFQESLPPESPLVSTTPYLSSLLPATHLKIRVTSGGETKIQLTLPATSLERLGDLLPEDLQTRITASGVDLTALAADGRLRNYAPGPICECHLGDKEVRLWLDS